MIVNALTQTCTKGIWIWSRPVFEPKENKYIFFLDAEGSGAVSKDEQYDAQIYTLALLMSSFFIYNSTGVINETSVSKLSLIS